MTVGSLSQAELRQQLTGAGLRIRIGPVVAEIRSPFKVVHSGIALHYVAHEHAGHDEFADFHVTVQAPARIRRWLKPQAVFQFEGTPPFEPLPVSQAYPLLEWGLNWCIATCCQQYLMIHSAVVERDGRAMLLPAPPGSGKSTLCAALVARGWRLLSDEIALIDRETGHVIPVPRPISLKNESIAAITCFWPEGVMTPTVGGTSKGSVAHVRPPSESVRLSKQSAKPGWIVVPHYQANAVTDLKPFSKGAAFMQLVVNAFNYSVHGSAGFAALADFVQASRCFEFTYGGALEEATSAFEKLTAAT